MATALPKVPTSNLGRMPRAEFGRVWAAAEHAATRCDPTDYYAAGVLGALRWVAGRKLRTPVTGKDRMATPELMDTEYMAAIRDANSTTRHPMRIGIAGGAAVVLRWLGHGGPEPVLVPTAEAG